MKVSLFFAWYDFWVGFFYDQKKHILYVCPLPCVVVKFERKLTPLAVDDASLSFISEIEQINKEISASGGVPHEFWHRH